MSRAEKPSQTPDSPGGSKEYGRTVELPAWMSGPGKIRSADILPSDMPDVAALQQGLTRRGPNSQTQSAAPRSGRRR